MASIQSLGVGSGLLTSELVEDIIAAEREATDLRLNARRAEFDARISAYGSVKSSLGQLRSAADGLSNSSTLLSKLATSTNENAVTASATASAESGVHSVEVLSLARSHTLATIQFDDIDTVIGDGTLDFRFGTTTFSGGNYDTFTENPEKAAASITIDSSNNTVTGIRDTINEAGIGVTANIVNDGTGYVLVLTTQDSGQDNGMEITVTEGVTPGLSALAFNASASTPGTNMTQTVAADDATLNVDGIVITRESNTISEVIAGVTFNAQSLNPGAPATITIAQDTTGIAEKMQAFVDAYNTVKSLTDELTDFDEDSETGALLMGDSALRGIRTQMRRFLSSSVVNLESTSIRSLVDLGITTNQNSEFQLQFDSQQFLNALSTSPDDVAALLADQKRASDNLVSFVSFQPGTVAGTYDVEITQAATQGVLLGQSEPSLNGNTRIDDDNDELVVVVDGVTSNSITLTQGNYAAADLAQELQNQVNADDTLSAAAVFVTVIYNSADRRFEFESASFGSSSQFGIASLDTNTTADLGLIVDTGETDRGVNVAGTINGIAGIGAGQFLSIPSGPVPATAGAYQSASITSFDTPPLTLDGTNNDFTLSVDGIISNGILLTEQDYASGAELASEMQTQINADAALSAAGKSVTVEYDTINKRFVITSGSTGSSSSVNM
ncbi:MAG: flagellar filament capping protein FliD, partial [Gammaproteobacteria bacterium]|nr:flagellar filament capping protein FliD [Gammaproteobacteria bacterium]